MTLAVFSMLAALNGDWPLWIGDTADLSRSADMRLSDPEGVFRAFNRVDDADCRRLEEWGYRLPSMSVGDLVVIDATTYRVDSIGFTKISDNKDMALRHVLGLS